MGSGNRSSQYCDCLRVVYASLLLVSRLLLLSFFFLLAENELEEIKITKIGYKSKREFTLLSASARARGTKKISRGLLLCFKSLLNEYENEVRACVCDDLRFLLLQNFVLLEIKNEAGNFNVGCLK